jgi:hypothetical protein
VFRTECVLPSGDHLLTRLAAALLAVMAAACGGGAPVVGDGGTASLVAARTAGVQTESPSASLPLQLFLQRYSDPRVSYHGKFVMNLGTARSHVVLFGEMDALGADWKGPVTVQVDKRTLEVEVIRKDGKTYARSAGGKWTVVPGHDGVSAAPQPFDPVGGGNMLKDVGMADREGRRLHWLQMRELTNPLPLQTRIGTTATITNFSYNIYVDDGGVPVETVLTMGLSASSGQARFSVRFQISDFGMPVVVTAPAGAEPTLQPQPAG